MATSEGIPSSIDIEFLELNDNPYIKNTALAIFTLRFAYDKPPCFKTRPYRLTKPNSQFTHSQTPIRQHSFPQKNITIE